VAKSKPHKPASKPKAKAKPAAKAPAKKAQGAKGQVKAKGKGKKHKPPPPPKAVKEALVPVLPSEAPPAASKHAPVTNAKPSIRDSEISEIRRMLIQRREELLAELRTDMKSVHAPEKPRSADPTDQASDAADGALSMALAQTESDELSQIETALARIESGDFGICEECGQSIPAERLKVLPYAVTCIDCKRSLEQAKREEGLEDAWEALDESEQEAPEEEG
jgi:DnaK suppressor protein